MRAVGWPALAWTLATKYFCPPVPLSNPEFKIVHITPQNLVQNMKENKQTKSKKTSTAIQANK